MVIPLKYSKQCLDKTNITNLCYSIESLRSHFQSIFPLLKAGFIKETLKLLKNRNVFTSPLKIYDKTFLQK